eukprot:Gb_26029 [translate_table: standard]
MNSFYFSSDQNEHDQHSVEIPAEGTASSAQINHGNGLMVSQDGSGMPDLQRQQQEAAAAAGNITVFSRVVDRLSTARWFFLIRRIFHYQNGREGSDLRLNPLNTGTWICFELVLVLAQIVSASVILVLSRNEKPISPLRLWVVGYAFGCCISIPILYWRYKHPFMDSTDQNNNNHQNSNPMNSLRMQYGRAGTEPPPISSDRGHVNADSRIAFFMERCRMSLDFFFAVWFVIGNVWVFGTRRTFSDEAPSLYRLCIALLALSCIGYALPFILFAVLCCCMPCISSIFGYSISSQLKERGASTQTIAALPTYIFKSMFDVKDKIEKIDSDDDDANGGGYIIDTMGRKRYLLAEDAECCICLTKYKENEYLKELPCVHLFHVGCVDQWLKINSSCPLCKHELRGSRNLTAHISSRARHEQEERSRRVIDIAGFSDR